MNQFFELNLKTIMRNDNIDETAIGKFIEYVSDKIINDAVCEKLMSEINNCDNINIQTIFKFCFEFSQYEVLCDDIKVNFKSVMSDKQIHKYTLYSLIYVVFVQLNFELLSVEQFEDLWFITLLRLPKIREIKCCACF